MTGPTFRTPFARPRLARAKSLVAALWISALLAPPVALTAQGPWTVTLAPAMDPLPLGFCIAVSLSLFDPAKQDHPRNPQGMRVLLSDFDLAVNSPDGAFAGRNNGPTSWFVCACQGSAVGTRAVITATYPAASLDPKARVKGVAFQVQSTITSAAPKGTDNPPECVAAQRAVAAGAPVGVVGEAPAQVRTAPVPAIESAPAPAPAPKEVTAAETAAPENPTGFTAVQTGDGQVQLTWQPVSAASYYVVFGPGSVSGGMKVTGAASYAVTGVPTGVQTFSVASYYDPGPASTSNSAGPDAVSTPAAEFPTASVTVTAPVAATPAAAPTSATARLTSFDPVKHGFHFHNDFQNSFIGPPVNMTTNGLCGGMSYSALDYFNVQKAVPLQDYRPANSTTIQSYLYGRQVTSLVTNLDKWAEYSFNPLGARTAEFFNWGLNERFAELKSFIDRGIPVPLGFRGEAGMNSDHQVLAFGYDAGRYAGGLGPFQDELKIFIYDPNFPNKSMTLVPDLAAKEFHYVERADQRWRSYFVDGKYSRMPPPTITTPNYPADGLTHELLLEITTGMDDMRGGADHVDVTIRLADNTTQFFPNVSQSGRWLPNYGETVQVVLLQPVAAASIKRIEIVTNAGGGVGGDNWDLASLQVRAVGGDFARNLLSNRAGPYRFTGARIPFVIDVK